MSDIRMKEYHFWCACLQKRNSRKPLEKKVFFEHYALVVEYFEEQTKTNRKYRKIYQAFKRENDKLKADHNDLDEELQYIKGKWKIFLEILCIKKKYNNLFQIIY